jgi:hypothetical protein
MWSHQDPCPVDDTPRAASLFDLDQAAGPLFLDV